MARALRTTRELEFQAYDDPKIVQEFEQGTICTRDYWACGFQHGDVLRHMDNDGRDWLLVDAQYDDWEVI